MITTTSPRTGVSAATDIEATSAVEVDHIAERWALENLPPWLSDLSVSI